MNLTEFLLARIAEDEAAAREDIEQGGSYVDGLHQERWQPARVLAECEAKRRIVAMQEENDEGRYLPGFHYKAQVIESILRTLALPYVDRTDDA